MNSQSQPSEPSNRFIYVVTFTRRFFKTYSAPPGREIAVLGIEDGDIGREFSILYLFDDVASANGAAWTILRPDLLDANGPIIEWGCKADETNWITVIKKDRSKRREVQVLRREVLEPGSLGIQRVEHSWRQSQEIAHLGSIDKEEVDYP